MDPFTAMMIGAVAPSVLSMFEPQQQFPNQSPVNNVNWQGMVPYQQQMLNNAFNPQSQLLSIALNKGAGGVNNRMASQGLAGSSLANQDLNQMTNDTQNQWIQNNTQRESSAYGSAMQGLTGEASVANMQNQDAWQRYLQTMQNQGNTNKAITEMLGAGLGAASSIGNGSNSPLNSIYANSSGFIPANSGYLGGGTSVNGGGNPINFAGPNPYSMPGPNTSGYGGNPGGFGLGINY